MYHLAQINIAKMLASIDDPIMMEFVNNLDRINTHGETAYAFTFMNKYTVDDLMNYKPSI